MDSDLLSIPMTSNVMQDEEKLNRPEEILNLQVVDESRIGTTMDEKTLQVKFRSIQTKIHASNIKFERKRQLEQKAEKLYDDLKTIRQAQKEGKRLIQIYIMEGATGVEPNLGRPSTDPDENMALASIVFLTMVIEQTTIIFVPDQANCQRTMQFIEELEGKAVLLPEYEEFLQPGLIYICSMVSKEEMKRIDELTRERREITVLGPPFGESHVLVTGENSNATKKVNIMGTAKIENGKFIGRSTNTREKASESFFSSFAIADMYKKVTFYSSSDMGKMTILFEEYQALGGTPLLLTKKDREQWIENTKQQFLGAFSTINDLKLPGSMLAKRMDSTHILTVLYGEHAHRITNFMKEDPGRCLLGFERFLEGSHQKLIANTTTLDQEIKKLEVTAVDWNNSDQVKQFLLDHIGKFQEHSSFQDIQELKNSYQRCIDYIDNMSMKEAKAVLVAILSALKNIYDEKTVDGWQIAIQDNGDPWNFVQFQNSFNTHGKQIPYDTLVVYAAALDKQKLDIDDGDNALLLISYS